MYASQIPLIKRTKISPVNSAFLPTIVAICMGALALVQLYMAFRNWKQAKAAGGTQEKAEDSLDYRRAMYTLCQLEDASGMSLNPVDAGGASAMIPALLGDQVDAGINSYGVFKQYVEDGSIIPLLTYGEERSEYFPDVPTVKELGYDCSAARAYFFGLPKGTNPAIAQKLSDAVEKIQENEEYTTNVSETYCVTPQFKPYGEALSYMDEIWAEMEPYTEIMNQ